ncbi:hypothetical protein IGI04_017160 [Brassica rapa subsp. trilocularis]|uniref:ATG8-interacting protein 1 n=2 Tax=Brassica campestris TaxID=3711 RepID=M4FDX9_BRACM|nr:ATG8-interacting protein 1 [Brassica rapa]XP_009142389.1 ATG8-interacting protein 1 [Brassica rapa]KAG5402553.1 hypothetical protein IGI04_017160 [Brassica rapa subsp. trilocularis]
MDKKEEHVKHPNEWEVVSLTSSAYAASPSPYNSRDAYYEAENSRDLFMSDHFVFPPSQHENLPLDDEEKKDGGQGFMLEVQESSDELRNEKSIYGEAALSPSQHMVYEHGLIDSEPNEYADVDLDPLGLEKDAKKATHDLPWWRRRAVSVYLRTREANAVWSLFFAAAVTGLVVLGQRWQQERWQVLQLNWHSSISSEKLSRVLEPLSRLKDVIVRGNPQASLLRSGTSSEI